MAGVAEEPNGRSLRFKLPSTLLFSFRNKKVKVTSLQTPQEWHVCKEGQAGNSKMNNAACLYFLNYLAMLWPTADRTVSMHLEIPLGIISAYNKRLKTLNFRKCCAIPLNFDRPISL
jgi:hypothetical protein